MTTPVRTTRFRPTAKTSAINEKIAEAGRTLHVLASENSKLQDTVNKLTAKLSSASALDEMLRVAELGVARGKIRASDAISWAREKVSSPEPSHRNPSYWRDVWATAQGEWGVPASKHSSAPSVDAGQTRGVIAGLTFTSELIG